MYIGCMLIIVDGGVINRKRLHPKKYPHKKRDANIVDLRKSGKTLQEISVVTGITGERIRQILRREARKNNKD